MGQALVSQLVPTLQKLSWSGEPDVTPAGALVYRAMIDQVDGYRGDPRVLGMALRTIRTADSLPYMYAGVAYILLAAAGPDEGIQVATTTAYDATGLEQALAWLERAQETAPDEVEINAIEALVYIHGERLEDGRLVLDYLQNQSPDNYFLMRTEMTYWQHMGDPSQALDWNARAFQEAETVPQRLRLKSVAAALHQQAGDPASALQAYTEALYFDENNAWLCHQISLLHQELDAIEDAVRYNEKALKLQPNFPEAQRLKESLADQQRSPGFLGRLFN